MFSHELRPKAGTLATAGPSIDNAVVDEQEGQRKRRRLDDSAGKQLPTPKVKPASFTGPSSAILGQPRAQVKPPSTLQKPVTPPPLQKSLKASAPKPSVSGPAKPEVKESLNPRKIARDPAGHAKRTLFLKYIHAEIQRLNEDVKKSSNPDKVALTLSTNEIIKAALDEEEQIACGNSNVYPNMIKNRIAAYKKMKPEDWIKHVKSTFAKANKPEPAAGKHKPLDTGLPLDHEHLFLDYMLSDLGPLAKFDYIPTPPTVVEMTEAEAAVAASLNYEVCDRCKSRFRVFPDRREEDGALTTNGPCVYHWARPMYPKREKTDAIKGSRDTVYGCCLEPLGTKGCTEIATHVFKINNPARLASVLPFITTPENPNPAKGPNGKVPSALTFDCEMGYTVRGFELMRLTAATWPEGDLLIDVLVRPQGAILDFNTRFSGITPEAYNSAKPYGTSSGLDSLLPPPPPGSEASTSAANGAKALPIVDSPAAARDLLCSYITPSTPLIGHALENDLNVVRLCHPSIIDTVLLFPHPRGLPIRYGLKALNKQLLDRDIQMAGASGHDSLEDARATGELVRFAVKKKWEEMKREGWKIEKGALMPPLPDLPPPPPSEENGNGPRVLGGGAGVKRQRIQVPDGTDADSLAKRQRP